MKKDDKRKILACGFLLIFIFLFIIILISKGKKELYYVMYRNSDDTNYSSAVIEISEKELIKKYSQYDFVIVEKILANTQTEYTKDKFTKLFEVSNKDFIFKLSDKTYISAYDVHAQNLVNLEHNDFDYDKLNSYLLEHDNYEVFNDFETLTIYGKESYFLKNNKLIVLENGPLYKITSTSEKLKNLDNIIINASNRLIAMSHENGNFTYGYYVLSGKQLSGYNSLRHAGTIWSLILSYQEFPREEFKQVIDSAIDFMITNYIYYDPNNNDNAYLLSSGQLNLGGNGLFLVTISEYEKVFNSDKYHDVAVKIANGILASQNEDGHITHTFKKDLTIDEDFVISYYDGEVTFGLMKFYEITNNPIYLESVTKAIDYFIANNYEQYKDHWISYALNEFIRYNHDEKYIEFLIKHYNKKNDTNTSFRPARVEALMSIYDAYDYLKKQNIESAALNSIDRDTLLNSVDINIKNLLRFYIDDEILIYFNDPEKVAYGFYAAHDDNRMRIDDIQHTLGALIHYKNLKDEKRI